MDEGSEEFEDRFEVGPFEPAVIDEYAETKRLTSLLGDTRKSLLDEGFSEKQAFKLVTILTALGVFTE